MIQGQMSASTRVCKSRPQEASEVLHRELRMLPCCRKETHCEFCDCQLPDWKKTLTPQCGANAPAVMNVNFDGRTYSFEVRPGPDGYKQFTEAIRKAFNLPDDSELNITFTCDEPVAVSDATPTTPPPSLPGEKSTPPSQCCEAISASFMYTWTPPACFVKLRLGNRLLQDSLGLAALMHARSFLTRDCAAAQLMPLAQQQLPVMMEEEAFTPPTSPSGIGHIATEQVICASGLLSLQAIEFAGANLNCRFS